MYKKYWLTHSVLLVLCFLISKNSNAAVTVQAPANGTCIDKTPGLFTTLSNITLIENLKSDLPSQTGKTIILSAPANFEFNPGIGSVVWGFPTPSGNIDSAYITVTASTITVRLNTSGTNKWDSLAIVGIQVRALAYNATGDILRLSGAAGGTATITGDAGGAGITHGFLSSEGSGSNSSIANGNWSNPAIWSKGAVPSCGDTVFIYHNVIGDIATPAEFLYIQTTGHLTANLPITVDNTFVINGNGIYTHNNTSDPSTTIFKGTESFSTTSTIIITKWSTTAIPLPLYVTGNFGNVTFSQGSSWSQDGLFAPAKIKGTLTVTMGTIHMDNGTGMTTSLTLQDVVVNNTGALRMCTGTARNFTLATGNYTDTSTSANNSSMLYNCAGNLTWTANGNVTIGHDWSAYQHTANNSGTTIVTINGNLSITGGSVDFNKTVDAPLTLTVTGNTTISGTPTYVRLIDSNTKNLNFTTNNLYIYGGAANDFMGGNNPTGNATINITNDCIMTGSTTISTFNNNSASTGSTTVTIGHDLLITNGEFRMANTNGTYTLNVSRNMVLSGASGKFRGAINANNTKLSSINVTGYVTVNLGTYTVSEGQGNIVVSIVEDVNINNGTYYGINNTTAPNNGSATISCTNITFNGGTFKFFNAFVTDGKTITINCNTDATINFLNASDIFSFISRVTANNAILDLNIGSNFTTSGNFPGSYFLSSCSAGSETIDIGGTATINAGDVYFAGNETTLACSHNMVTNITGNLNVTGGNIRLSTGAGTDTINIAGNVAISGGTASLKFSTGSSVLTVAGTYTQTAGTFNIHSDTLTTTTSSKVTVTDNFSLTGGTFNFENCVAGSGLAEHALYINGSTYTLGGSAIITHANNLTANYIFGQIYFSRTGTTTYSRTTSTNDIRDVKYTINSGTTLNASASTNGFLMTSVGVNVAATHNSLTVNGVIDMGDKVLSARQYGAYYSRVTVNSGGRYRLSHTGGLYSGVAATPSSINGYVTTFNRVNFTLDPNSIVEYYGTATGIITGIPNGAASTTSQKYGILEINFTGTAGSTWLYPETDDEIKIRTSLILTAGEFNLDNDHVTASGGRSINLETGATMSRTSGFIRSESEDGTGLVKWNITTNGSRIYHFGYDAATYIPFTFQQTSGSAGVVALGTYRTATNNTPFPPTVTHVNDLAGNDNSGNTVDRFWSLTVPGTTTSNLTYTYAASEGTGIISPRAQQWEPVTKGWFPSAGTQSNPTATTTYASGLTSFNTWWTLSSAASPLPVSLLNFEVIKNGDQNLINWTTATEINNDFFTVERSGDGSNFNTLAIVNGAGNSNTILHYSAIDNNPLTGRNYYRLKQTDYDGHFTFSAIKSLNFSKSQKIVVYPNPATALSILNIEVSEKGEYVISLFNSEGKIIYSEVKNIGEDKFFSINLSSLNCSSGLYSLRVEGNEAFSHKILIR